MKLVPENIYLKTCSTSFPGAESASPSLNSLEGMLKVKSCSNLKFNPWKDRWQMPLESANLSLIYYWSRHTLKNTQL